MTSKIKEFKGSLNPVFDDAIRHQQIDEQDSTKPVAEDCLPINQIKPRHDQPRKNFDEDSLDELTQSIKAKGVIQPIIVRLINKGFYEIIVGERRWRAAKEAGLENIPAIIRDYNKSDCMAVSLIENIQRESLNPLEEAEAIHSLIEECSMTHLQVAANIGKSRVAVTNLLRLLNLESAVQAMVNLSLLDMGHARALLVLSGQEQVDTAKLVVDQSLSVRDTERLVKRRQQPIVNKTLQLDPIFEAKVKQWKNYMSQQLSSKVNLQVSTGGNGKMLIYFDSIEEADWLIDHIDIKKDANEHRF